MKVLIPEDLKGKELFKFLIENKTDIINEKKSIVKYTDAFSFKSAFAQKKEAQKADTENPTDPNKIRVKVVANTAYFCDSQMDVILPDAPKRSIRERKGLIPHINNHNHNIEAKVGEVYDIYLQDLPLTDLGLQQQGFTQALIFETDIIKSYNEKIFNQYKAGNINQHSIGLQYVKLDIAINDEGSEKEFDFWNKYIDKVINKDVAEANGFFFVVSEYKLLENSCVLFGSNSLTPTLEAKNHPGPDIQEADPSTVPIGKAEFDWKSAIHETQFIKI